MKLEHHAQWARGGKSPNINVLKGACTQVSLKVDIISDARQKKSAQ